jgi:hypothetical protein
VGVVVRQRRRVLWATVGAAAVLAATTSAAKAAVTVGFTDYFGPPPPALCINPSPQDLVQATGPAAGGYTVPVVPGQSLVVSSWSHHAAVGSVPIGFKVYRPVSGLTYRVVGHDGPRALTSGVVNTFSGLHLPVLPGDIIGLHTAGADTACHFNVPGQSYLLRSGDLADGQEGAFSQNLGEQLNVSALISPDDRITLGRVKRNKKRGTAKVTLNIPNPGSVFISSKQVRVLGGPRNRQVNAGGLTFVVGAAPIAKTKLLARGKLRVEIVISYVPAGGAGVTHKFTVKLRKRLR